MFEPTFQYTDVIVNNLTRIEEARTIINRAPLIPNWELSLRKAAFLTSAHSSTAIEGNTLSFEEVTALAEGRNITVRRKDRQEVLNYFSALEKIPDFASENPLTETDLLEIHRIITEETLDNSEDEGSFRNRQVVVGNRITGEVIFRPPDTAEVTRLIGNFLEWFNSPQLERFNPVITSGITHYELVRIHPFIDGNGRTARIMAMLVLYKKGYDVKRFFSLDDFYDMDRAAYYEALNSVNQESLDLTNWLEYFTEGVAVSIKAVEDKVLGLSRHEGQIPLNERQMKIVEKLIAEKRIANRDIQEMFNLSHSSAFDEIKKLLDLKVIKQMGAGRSVHYVLRQDD